MSKISPLDCNMKGAALALQYVPINYLKSYAYIELRGEVNLAAEPRAKALTICFFFADNLPGFAAPATAA